MGLFEFLKGVLKRPTVPLSGIPAEFFDEYRNMVGEIYVRELALASAINFIAAALTNCEFKTFVKGKEQKSVEHFRWNVSPNKNQSAAAFRYELVNRLFRKGECLVVEDWERNIHIADSYIVEENVINGSRFREVQVGGFSFRKTFFADEVCFFKLSETNMSAVINGLYDSYAKLILYEMKSFQRAHGRHGKFTYEALPPPDTEARKAFDDLINNRFKEFLTLDSAVIPLAKGQDYEEIMQKTNGSTADSSRGIRNMINDICDFTAKALNIPPTLLSGEIAGIEDAVKLFLSFCLDPLAEMISQTTTKSIYGQNNYKNGSYFYVDTSGVENVSLMTAATAIDKLISSGAFSVNDIRIACGKPRIEEPWADEHFITKNYEKIKDNFTVKGGEKNGI